MVWFLVDDDFPFHRKTIQAGNAAIGLWVRAGSMCMKQLTDGQVPRHMLPTLGTQAQAAKLVEVGLWHVAGHDCPECPQPPADGTYLFHDWLTMQRSKAQVGVDKEWNRRRTELLRDKDLVAAIRARDKDRCRYCGILVSWSDRRSPNGATYDHVIPRGPNSLENVVVACRGCNGSKGGRTPAQWGRALLPPGSLGIQFVSNTDQVRVENDSETNLSPSPSPIPRGLVRSGRHLESAPGGLADDEMTRVESITGGDRAHAERVVADILSRATTPPKRPLAYVLRALGDEPERYRPTRRGVRKGELCPVRGHSDKADGCKQCAADRAAGA